MIDISVSQSLVVTKFFEPALTAEHSEYFRPAWLCMEFFKCQKIRLCYGFWLQSSLAIVSRGKWLGLCLKTLDPAHLLFYVHWLCMNYIIAMLLLVNFISTHNHLLYFSRFCAGSTPKIANKNTQQRAPPAMFLNHSPLLHVTMVSLNLMFINICGSIYGTQ